MPIFLGEPHTISISRNLTDLTKLQLRLPTRNMSIEALLIGNELKDSYKLTSKWSTDTTLWLGDIEDFYRERAALEKEYAAKLQDLCKRHFDRKAKVSSVVSVGDEPRVTPGSLECASLVLWTDVLSNTEAVAQEHVDLSNELTTRVAGGFTILKNKCSRLVKQVDGIYDTLLHDKTAIEDEVSKAKRHYDSFCQATETARERAEKLGSDKYQQKLQSKTVEMNNGKNDYLIKINIANRLKDKYYYQDIPELLDYLQEINETRVALANHLLHDACSIERSACDKIKAKLNAIDITIDQNDPRLDTAMYIKHNAEDWQEPADFYFIPCSTWHDDESLVVQGPELTTLRKRLADCSSEYVRLEQQCLDSKQKLEEVNVSRRGDSAAKPSLKFDANMVPALSLLQSFFKGDSLRVSKQVEIEVIQNFAGDKDLTYVEEKAPRKSRFGFLRKSKSDHNHDGDDDVKLSHTVISNPLGRHDSGKFTLRRNKTGASRASTSTAGERCRILYPYVLQSPDEASMTVDDSVSVLEADEGNGWTLVNVNGQTRGLVPSLYIEYTPATQTAGDDDQKRRGPAVAPKRGAKRVQHVIALYDYEADGQDELTIHAGDKIVLIQADTDASGWTEGELNGKRGLFPTSYVQ